MGDRVVGPHRVDTNRHEPRRVDTSRHVLLEVREPRHPAREARSRRDRASYLSVEGPKFLAYSGADLGGGALFRGRAFSFKARDLRLKVLVPHVGRKLGGVSKEARLAVDDACRTTSRKGGTT